MLMNPEDKRKHTLFIDYNNIDYYNFYKKEFENPVTLATYRSIMKEVNTSIKDAIADKGYDFKLPSRLGIIGIRKHKAGPRIEEGKKVGFNLPVDWKATTDLWKDDPSAKEDKILIRHENKHSEGYIYSVRLFKRTANYKNKTLYKFKPMRTLARQLSLNIKNNNLDVFVL